MGDSEVFKGLCISNALSETHFVQFLEVAFGILGLALLVHFPGLGNNSCILRIATIWLAVCETIRRKVACSWLASADIVFNQ